MEEIEVEPGLLKRLDDCTHDELRAYQRRLMGATVMGAREGDSDAAERDFDQARDIVAYIHERFGRD